MDRQGGYSANPSMGIGGSGAQLPYGSNPYLPSQVSDSANASMGVGGRRARLPYGSNPYQPIQISDNANPSMGVGDRRAPSPYCSNPYQPIQISDSPNPSTGVTGCGAQLPRCSSPYQPSQISGASGSVVTSAGTIQTTTQPTGVTGGVAQLPRSSDPSQPSQMSGASGSVVTSAGTIQTTSQPTGVHQQQLQQQLKHFWEDQYQEIDKVTDLKTLSTPLKGGIRKIMIADKDVKAISDEAPDIVARACEMFVSELTLRSWYNTVEKDKKTLQIDDIAAAIAGAKFYFLVDSEPQEDMKDEALASIPRGTMPVADPAIDFPLTYPSTAPQQAPQAGATVMDPRLYAQQPHSYRSQPIWPHPQEHQQPFPDH